MYLNWPINQIDDSIGLSNVCGLLDTTRMIMIVIVAVEPTKLESFVFLDYVVCLVFLC